MALSSMELPNNLDLSLYRRKSEILTIFLRRTYLQIFTEAALPFICFILFQQFGHHFMHYLTLSMFWKVYLRRKAFFEIFCGAIKTILRDK